MTRKHADTFKQIEALESEVYQQQRAIHLWHLELRDAAHGYIEGTDRITGTEQEAMQEARQWLREALTLDSYQKEILVINVETEECVYQGTFEMVPTMEGTK